MYSIPFSKTSKHVLRSDLIYIESPSSCHPPPRHTFLVTEEVDENVVLSSLQFSSVTQSCPTLCDPMNCSTPDLPVHHQLPGFTQTHVHGVGDAIQPISSSVVPFSSCPQSLPAWESFLMSQLFAWSGQSTGVSALASFLPKKHPGLISFRMDWLDLLAVVSVNMTDTLQGMFITLFPRDLDAYQICMRSLRQSLIWFFASIKMEPRCIKTVELCM